MSDIFRNEENNHVADDDHLVPKKDNRRSWNMYSIRRNAAWKDDTIAAGEVKVLLQIGRGRFGEVSLVQILFWIIFR